MKIYVMENTQIVSFEAENTKDIYFVGVLSGKFPDSVSYQPGEDSPAAVRVSYKDLLDFIITRK